MEENTLIFVVSMPTPNIGTQVGSQSLTGSKWSQAVPSRVSPEQEWMGVLVALLLYEGTLS